ncbi:MAG TPA: ester cyclase [Candidatus Dormibacteraeota bacterium]|nr:ester cyclase [Candidatus Dormibacteraeota bacterium]
MAQGNKDLIRRYYEEMWNTWQFDLADELIDPEVRFRGSLGRMVAGRGGLVSYMKHIQGIFPDYYNSIETLVAEDDRIAAQLTYSGTHRGEIFGIAATGRRIRYSGVGIFQITSGKIVEGWVLGDLANLLLQLRPQEHR